MPENSVYTPKTLPHDQSQRSGGLCGLIAIETSGRSGSVAWADGEQPPRSIRLDPQQRTAATLTAAIAELLAEARQQNRRLDMVAVTNGPGSFTGLRIGVTAAKMLAYGLNCPVVAVDTLAAMAAALWRTRPECDAATVALNAYRQQLFIAHWSRDLWEAAAAQNTLASHSQVCSTAAWQAQLADPRPEVTMAAEPSVARSSQHAGAVAPVIAIEPTAIDVAAVGRRLADGGYAISPLELKPNYLRDSAAEEKLR